MKFKKKSLAYWVVGATLILSASFLFLSSMDAPAAEQQEVTGNLEENLVNAEVFFGIPVGDYQVDQQQVAKNDFLSTILDRYHIPPTTVSQLSEKSKGIFDVRKISLGRPYTVYKDEAGKAAYFIYQPNEIDYIVYDLRDSVKVYAGKKDVEKRIASVSGIIDGSLYGALEAEGASPDLAVQLAEIYGWAVNFYRINKGDWFKILYERTYVEGEPLGSGRILSAIFSQNGKEYQAYYFQAEGSEKGGYYDENGNSLKRSFLKAPLKYSRISSKFTMRRLHPVQRIWKAHLGTDFAAPHGTPIVATADGVVTESSFGSGNGNYVKLKHDAVYETQYLHMSKRAVKKGQRVTQGQVIGYVGSTGLATGPHVCYRFWKNGKQVDALKQQFAPSTPISAEYKHAFAKLLSTQQHQLANLHTDHEAARLAQFNQRLLNMDMVLFGSIADERQVDSVEYVHHSML